MTGCWELAENITLSLNTSPQVGEGLRGMYYMINQVAYRSDRTF